MNSHAEPESRPPLSRRLRVGPVFKALLISIAAEFAVLLVTGGALASSMMRHSAAAPRPVSEDLLANLCLLFHLPSILIVAPFGLLLVAPLVQVGLMTLALGLVFRARERGRTRRRGRSTP